VKFRIDYTDSLPVVRIQEIRATADKGVGNLAQALRELVNNGEVNVIVDMSVVEYADSTTMGTLITALKSSSRKRGTFCIFGLNESVRELFELTRLYRVFGVHETEQEAVASFLARED